MKIWLTKIGEPLEVDGDFRLHRCGILGRMLAKRGHQVTWWTSTFSHQLKKFRFNHRVTLRPDATIPYKQELLHAKGYSKNISLKRILHHRTIAREYRKALKDAPQPDLIFCSFPIIEFVEESLNYASPRGIPVVIDIRDHWPDKFLDVLPKFLKPIGDTFLFLAHHRNRKAFRAATALTGISNKQLTWGLTNCGREKSKLDLIAPMGYPDRKLDPATELNCVETLKEKGVNLNSFIVCFFGSVGPQYNFEAIFDLCAELEKLPHLDVSFVICGTGSYLKRCRDRARNFSNIVFPGWVTDSEIRTLMKYSTAGLAPYYPDSSMALPNKPFEYLCGGLPIISSLRGELESLLSQYNCGRTYTHNDVKALVLILEELYKNKEVLDTMSMNARAIFESKFSAKKIYSDLIGHLEAIANSSD